MGGERRGGFVERREVKGIGMRDRGEGNGRGRGEEARIQGSSDERTRVAQRPWAFLSLILINYRQALCRS